MKKLLVKDASLRMSTGQALRHPFITGQVCVSSAMSFVGMRRDGNNLETATFSSSIAPLSLSHPILFSLCLLLSSPSLSTRLSYYPSGIPSRFIIFSCRCALSTGHNPCDMGDEEHYFNISQTEPEINSPRRQHSRVSACGV